MHYRYQGYIRYFKFHIFFNSDVIQYKICKILYACYSDNQRKNIGTVSYYYIASQITPSPPTQSWYHCELCFHYQPTLTWGKGELIKIRNIQLTGETVVYNAKLSFVPSNFVQDCLNLLGCSINVSTKLLTFGYIHAGKYQISLLVWFRPVPINLEGKNYKVIL